MRNWTPSAEGRTFDLRRILNPVSAMKDDLLVLAGYATTEHALERTGPGDHARASASFLTGVHPKNTAGSDISVGISVDQVAAQKIGSSTRLASLNSAARTATWRGTATRVIAAHM